jgi:hypothetical protein
MADRAPPGLADVASFPLMEALGGRRARRFALGASIPDGPLQFTSPHEPVPLTDLERMLVLTATAGNTGWNYLIMRHAGYAPFLSNYSAAAGGRTFPSAAGFHTSELFFTDDSGIFLFETRDAPALVEQGHAADDLVAWMDAHRSCIRRLSGERLHLPREEPYFEGHNTWCVNVPGSLLAFPIADLAQHTIAGLCFLAQNGYCLIDDVNGQPIPGIEAFRELVNVDEPFPLSFIEQYMLSEATAELSASCYAGVLTLQAMGLGGWMFDGVDRFSVLGASGVEEVPGLGFDVQMDERWAMPNPTGKKGVFEAYCPPYYADMRAATEALVARKFGPGGPYHADTPGPWLESPRIRASAQVHDEQFIDCVATQAQYILDAFGKFPGTVPTLQILMYLQAHHLELDFYDHYFGPGAYLPSHATHMERWHPGS